MENKGKLAFEQVESTQDIVSAGLGIADERAQEMLGLLEKINNDTIDNQEDVLVSRMLSKYSQIANTPQELAYAVYTGSRMMDAASRSAEREMLASIFGTKI